MEDFIGRTNAGARTAKDTVCVAICDDEAFMLDILSIAASASWKCA